MHNVSKIFLITFLLCNIIYVLNASAATITAASCSQSDVQAAINSASAGDTVQIPNGNCSWSSAITINKAITVKGNGIYAVDADNQDTGTWPLTINISSTAFVINSSSTSGKIRISGINFNGSAGFTYGCTTTASGVIFENPNNKTQYRIDNCKFNSSSTSVYTNSYYAYGLIDHIYHSISSSDGHQLMIQRCGSSNQGDESFTDPVGYGSGNFVFVEDSTFIRSNIGSGTAPCVIDAQAGGRYVFRYNYVRNSFALQHGTESGAPCRGGYAFEVYNNTFYWWASGDRYANPFYNRGGTILFHHNTITNYQTVVKFWVRRANDSWGRFGRCDGTHPWDGNTSPTGYACLDQVGRGQASSSDITYAQPQESKPTRIWHNTTYNTGGGCGGTQKDSGMTCHNNPDYTVAGRDYYYCTDDSCAEPSYTPYTYPHPLATGEGTPPDTTPPPTPSNLSIVQ